MHTLANVVSLAVLSLLIWSILRMHRHQILHGTPQGRLLSGFTLWSMLTAIVFLALLVLRYN